MNLYWPIALVVLSNIIYHICAKSSPENIDPFASLTVTYLVSALFSGILFFATSPSKNLLQEYTHINWTVFILGLAVVGLEAGSIYMYRVGWNINTGSTVQSVILAIALLLVGFLLYKEAITPNKVIGIAICMVGLYFLNQ